MQICDDNDGSNYRRAQLIFRSEQFFPSDSGVDTSGLLFLGFVDLLKIISSALISLAAGDSPSRKTETVWTKLSERNAPTNRRWNIVVRRHLRKTPGRKEKGGKTESFQEGDDKSSTRRRQTIMGWHRPRTKTVSNVVSFCRCAPPCYFANIGTLLFFLSSKTSPQWEWKNTRTLAKIYIFPGNTVAQDSHQSSLIIDLIKLGFLVDIILNFLFCRRHLDYFDWIYPGWEQEVIISFHKSKDKMMQRTLLFVNLIEKKLITPFLLSWLNWCNLTLLC